MMLMLLTGQRVRRYWLYRSCRSTAALGRQEAALTSAFCGHEADEMVSALTPDVSFSWPVSESKTVDDPYKMFHVWMGGSAAGLRLAQLA
jgi:hypothetical protein